MKKKFNLFSPIRVFRIFFFMMTAFLIIIKKKRFLIFKPLSPHKFRQSIEKLGSSFIKFAQVLGTRADLFPPEYLCKLTDLHDEIDPMSLEDFEIVFNRAFAKYNPFTQFEKQPIASASIGQVHVAYLENGDKVAVKLRRNNIDRVVKADIKILKFLCKLFKPLFSTYTKNSIESVIEEFADMILMEIDFKREFNNIIDFSNIYDNSGILFPKAYGQFSNEEALVMTFEEGFRFDDKNELSKQNLDFKALMHKLIAFYTDQMLLNGYFHADPHPGNLLVNNDGDLILLDFGMVKRIPDKTRIAMIEIAKAANEYDFEMFVACCKKLGIIAFEAKYSLMQEYAEKMFEIFGNEKLNASSMRSLVLEVLQSMQEFPFKLPQEVIYVLRATTIIEGLGTTYIDNFNGVKDILPILQEHIPGALMSDEKLLTTFISDLNNFPFTLQKFRNTLSRLNDGTMTMNISREQVDWIEKEVRSYLKGIVIGFLFMFIGLICLIMRIEPLWPGWIIMIFGALKLIYSL